MILVVDDHHDSRQALLRLLALDGFDASGASDGHEALEMIRVHRPAVVVLDQNMPDMLGTDVLRTIKSDPNLAAIPVLFYTATSPNQGKAEALRLGADGWIMKAGVSWMELRDKIEHAQSHHSNEPMDKKSNCNC